MIIIFIIIYIVSKGNNLISIYIDRLIYRMQRLEDNDISNGRFELWDLYLNIFRENSSILWLGGMDYTKFGIEMVAHNMIIEQLAAYGIIGSFILFILYLNIFLNIKIKSNSTIRIVSAGVIPLLSFLIISMFSHTLLGVPQTIMLYISAYGILEEVS